MEKHSRKAAIAAYRSRKSNAGIYVLRCAPAGRQWVGFTPDFGSIRNRVFFALRLGSHMSADLQAAWNQHGADGLAFEEVERFEPEDIPAGEARKARLAHWRRELNALPA